MIRKYIINLIVNANREPFFSWNTLKWNSTISRRVIITKLCNHWVVLDCVQCRILLEFLIPSLGFQLFQRSWKIENSCKASDYTKSKQKENGTEIFFSLPQTVVFLVSKVPGSATIQNFECMA